jgi:hypothetical protein
LVVLSIYGDATEAADFQPRPAEATLTGDERKYPRVGVQNEWFPTHVIGERRFRVDGNVVIEVGGADTGEPRRASVGAEYQLRWMGAAEGIAFLAADRDFAKRDPTDPETDRQFHRLELSTMKWLDPLKLPAPSIKLTHRQDRYLAERAKDKPKSVVLARRLIVTPGGVVVLSDETAVFRGVLFAETVLHLVIGQHVTCFPVNEVDAKWDRVLRDGNPPSPDFGFVPTDDDTVERLQYVPAAVHDTALIVACPGDRSDVTCLTADDGKVRWRIPAIWEYERGFIGPSVFEHYIERFGLDYMTVSAAREPVPTGYENTDRKIDAKTAAKELQHRVQQKIKAVGQLAAAKKTFYARYEARITAGPIVVNGVDDFKRSRIYVAVRRSLKPEPGRVEQPEHGLIYEIDPHDQVAVIRGMTLLPRAVVRRPYRHVPGGIVLSCDRGCMVRLRTYETVFGGFMGPGAAADDLVLQIDWYREYLMRTPAAWLSAEPAASAPGFSKSRMFRPGSAYIRKKEDKIYELQINVVDLRTGLDRDLTLSIPFDGEIAIPETGVSSFNGEQFAVHGRQGVWIDDLRVDGKRLAVVVAVDARSPTELTFDLSALLDDE